MASCQSNLANVTKPNRPKQDCEDGNGFDVSKLRTSLPDVPGKRYNLHSQAKKTTTHKKPSKRDRERSRVDESGDPSTTNAVESATSVTDASPDVATTTQNQEPSRRHRKNKGKEPTVAMASIPPFFAPYTHPQAYQPRNEPQIAWQPIVHQPYDQYRQPWPQTNYNAQAQPYLLSHSNPYTFQSTSSPTYPSQSYIPPAKRKNLPLTHSPAYISMTDPPPQPLSQPEPLLIVLDLNGTLLFRPKSSKTITPRPGLHDFLTYCFNNHRVMIWTSSQPVNMNKMLDFIFTEPHWGSQLVSAWGRDTFGLTAQQYHNKVDVVKDLDQVWQSYQIQATHPWRAAGWSWGIGNTVLIDDTVKKAVRQPWNLIRVPEFEGSRVGHEANANGVRVLDQVREHIEWLRAWDNVASYMRRWPLGLCGELLNRVQGA